MDWTRGRTIGRGSSATVSLASTASGTSLAVKSAELAHSAILQREHQIFTSLGFSPHIVTYKGCDISTEGNTVIFNLFMEYAAGGTLTDAVRGGRIDARAIGRYTWQILKGLEFLHSLGYAHCDIKGRNILVTGTGAKIADLGCAKRVSSDSPAEKISGTPAFMAPEVARGEEQGFASDVWSLGCTVVEMATASPPWPEEADPVAVLYRIAFSGDVPEIPSCLSGEGKDFLGKCLRRDPKQRWTAVELLKHPFLAEFDSEEKQLNSTSPTSVLDRCLWSSDEEPETPASQSRAVPEDSGLERIRRLCVINPNHSPSWRSDDSWITIRFDDMIASESLQIAKDDILIFNFFRFCKYGQNKSKSYGKWDQLFFLYI